MLELIRAYIHVSIIWLRKVKGLLYVYGGNLSFSQEGEDVLISRILPQHINKGFYVDVGAHHPLRFSNTYMFYLRGWRGINIDPNYENMKLFKIVRPKDINITGAISSSTSKTEYYMFNEPALNTLKRNENYVGLKSTNRLERTVVVKTYTLANILERYLPKTVDQIDLFSIDTEGHDLEVLKSNDWVRYRPKYIIVESLGENIFNSKHKIYKFLNGLDYKLISKLQNSEIYVSNV